MDLMNVQAVEGFSERGLNAFYWILHGKMLTYSKPTLMWNVPQLCSHSLQTDIASLGSLHLLDLDAPSTKKTHHNYDDNDNGIALLSIQDEIHVIK